MQAVFFISDLHLRPQANQTNEFLDEFIETVFTPGSNTLYILGDLFDFWIGDDGAEKLGYLPQLDLLNRLTATNNTVYFMHGNRDFLVGTAFAQATGITLLDDPTRIELEGKQCLLKHGDDLCTDDVEHQQFRAMTREPQWQQSVLSKTIDERLAIASQMRQMSGSSYKPSDIMDVNDDCIEQTFIKHEVDIIIHGHTHRPGVHNLSINGSEKQRFVLGDWHHGISYLKVDRNGFNLVHE